MLTNIRSKCVTRKIKFYFVDVMKNGHIRPSKICHFHFDHRFIFNREIRSITKISLQKRIKFGCPGYICFGIYQDTYKRKIGVYPSHFLQNILIEASNVCFKNFQISYLALLHFLMSWSLEDSKYFEVLLIGWYSIWRPP